MNRSQASDATAVHDPGSLTQIPIRSTAGLIADQLRLAIMYGRLAPGEQLGESELAVRFGVSRGPLREALQRLVQEGLLTSVRNRGVFVTTLSPEDVHDIYLVRGAIERSAALLILAGDYLSAAEQLAEAQAVMNEAATSGDHAALSDADQRFHEILVDASGSTRLRRMATTVLVESRMCMTALEEKYLLPDDALHEHFEIVEALRRGDREAVLACLDAHMERAVQLLASGSSPDGD
jgi:DNA-binding GntR family transcriptional regulator